MVFPVVRHVDCLNMHSFFDTVVLSGLEDTHRLSPGQSGLRRFLCFRCLGQFLQPGACLLKVNLLSRIVQVRHLLTMVPGEPA